jgi:hypothetical protein
MNEPPTREQARELELEQRIARALRTQPLRRAPVTLEQRVLAALRAPPALPWWRKSLLLWPWPARIAFGVTAAGAALLSTEAIGWCSARVDSSPLLNFLSSVGHSVPTLWLYAAGFLVAMLYAAGLGLGALAWRTLFTSR